MVAGAETVEAVSRSWSFFNSPFDVALAVSAAEPYHRKLAA